MKKVSFEKILFFISIAFYVIVGIIALIFSVQNYEQEGANILMGIAMLLSGVPHIFIYIIQKGYKNFFKSSFFVFGLVAMCFGIVFIAGQLTIEMICIIWGSFDIIRGAFELKDVIPEVKENKLEIIELFTTIGDIVLGILLCAHMIHGIPLHLIYMGLSYFLIAVKKILEVVLENEKE